MKNVIDFLNNNPWIYAVIYEVIVRLIPTASKYYSIIEIINKLWPNLRKGGGLHLLIFSLISISSFAQQNINARSVRWTAQDTATFETTCACTVTRGMMIRQTDTDSLYLRTALNKDSSGRHWLLYYNSGGGGNVNFANNGNILSGDTVQWGGSLTKNTFIEGYKKLDFGDNLPLNQFQVTTGRNDFSTQSFLTIYSDSASGTTNNYFELSSYYRNKHAGILAHVSSSADQLEIQQQGNGFINLSTGLSGGSLIERFSVDSIGNIKILPNGTTGSNGQFLRTDGTGKSSWNGIYFKNGLTKQSDSATVKLGGLLTNNTTINMNGYNLNINSGNVISTGAFWGLGISPSYRLDVNGTTNSAIYRTDNLVLSDTTSNILTWNSTSGNFQRRRASSLGGGSPAGSNTQIQYNNSGSFGATPNLTISSISGNNATVTVGAGNKLIRLQNQSDALIIADNTAGTKSLQMGYRNSNDHGEVLSTGDLDVSGDSTTISAGVALVLKGLVGATPISLITANSTSSGDISFTTGNASAGSSGNINLSTGTATSTKGNISLNASGFIILTGLPTTCSGAPTGALANVGGVLTICP